MFGVFFFFFFPISNVIDFSGLSRWPECIWRSRICHSRVHEWSRLKSVFAFKALSKFVKYLLRYCPPFYSFFRVTTNVNPTDSWFFHEQLCIAYCVEYIWRIGLTIASSFKIIWEHFKWVQPYVEWQFYPSIHLSFF